MSQENVEIVRRGLEYFMRTDEHLWETIDPEVEIHDHDLPDAGVYRGHAGWLEWEDQFDGMWEDPGGLEPEEYIDASGDRPVVVDHRSLGRLCCALRMTACHFSRSCALRVLDRLAEAMLAERSEHSTDGAQELQEAVGLHDEV